MSGYWYRKDDHTSRGLLDLCQVMGPGIRVMVEVGSADGGSICVFKRAYPDAQVIAVDPWINGSNYGEEIFQGFLKNVAAFNDVAYIREQSLRAAPLFKDGTLDFVYLDPIHTYDALSADLEAWILKIKRGGWIGGHDYSDEFPGVIQAVEEAKIGPVYRFCDTSWLFRIPTL